MLYRRQRIFSQRSLESHTRTEFQSKWGVKLESCQSPDHNHCLLGLDLMAEPKVGELADCKA